MGQKILTIDEVDLPGYNVVSLTEKDLIVRNYRYEVR